MQTSSVQTLFECLFFNHNLTYFYHRNHDVQILRNILLVLTTFTYLEIFMFCHKFMICSPFCGTSVSLFLLVMFYHNFSHNWYKENLTTIPLKYAVVTNVFCTLLYVHTCYTLALSSDVGSVQFHYISITKLLLVMFF